MKTFNETQGQAYKEAVDHVKKVKGFYMHLFWYFLVNGGFTVFIMYQRMHQMDHPTMEGFFENFQFSYFNLWFWWGIGLFFNWYGVFGKSIFFGKKWEERKIQNIMDQDEYINHRR